MAYVDSNTAPKKVYLLEESDVEKGDVLICSFSSSLFFFCFIIYLLFWCGCAVCGFTREKGSHSPLHCLLVFTWLPNVPDHINRSLLWLAAPHLDRLFQTLSIDYSVFCEETRHEQNVIPNNAVNRYWKLSESFFVFFVFFSSDITKKLLCWFWFYCSRNINIKRKWLLFQLWLRYLYPTRRWPLCRAGRPVL